MRLQKFLARAGIASRRSCEEFIKQGRVKVNGKIVTEMGFIIHPEEDKICFDDKPVRLPKQNYYLLLYKPAGYLTTAKDTYGRPTVLDLVKDIPRRLFPVGRLDQDTEGVLLLTDGGELAHRLMHPRFEVKKTYKALVKGIPEKNELLRLAKGVELPDGNTSPAEVKLLTAKNDRAVILIAVHEGRKHQVKRMFAAINYPVIKLKRIRFAFLGLKGLEPGSYRKLNRREIQKLRRLVGLS